MKLPSQLFPKTTQYLCDASPPPPPKRKRGSKNVLRNVFGACRLDVLINRLSVNSMRMLLCETHTAETTHDGITDSNLQQSPDFAKVRWSLNVEAANDRRYCTC